MMEAKVVEDSINSWTDIRLITMQLKYPRFIHAEFMTHRMFSRNASSSRAIPVEKIIQDIKDNPVYPSYWGKNQSGMQAREELDEEHKEYARLQWDLAKNSAIEFDDRLANIGAHKQIVNRILEPFSHISVVVTATDWDNFFMLRDHPDAQPEIKELAVAMRAAYNASEPKERPPCPPNEDLNSYRVHLPYLTKEERLHLIEDYRTAAKVSAARCARVSYNNHDGSEPDIEKDLKLFERLAGSIPRHLSPMEHQAIPMFNPSYIGNFFSWKQFRKVFFEDEAGQLGR